MKVIKDGDAYMDTAGRIPLRGNTCTNDVGPRVLTVPDTISACSLSEMDKTVKNFKDGNVSPIIDLSDFE